MKVKELISRLEGFDPEAGVLIIYSPYHSDDIEDVVLDCAADINAGESSVAVVNY